MKTLNLEEKLYEISKIIENSIEGDWLGINHEKWTEEIRSLLQEARKAVIPIKRKYKDYISEVYLEEVDGFNQAIDEINSRFDKFMEER